MKVSIFSWRLGRNRLPTKDNLVKHGIFHTNLNVCTVACDFEEKLDRLFLGCKFFGDLVLLVQWMSISLVNPLHVMNHVIQFGALAGYSKKIICFMHIAWLATPGNVEIKTLLLF